MLVVVSVYPKTIAVGLCSERNYVLPCQCSDIINTVIYKYRMFQKELYSGVPNVTVWRVLRKRLHLKVYKLSVVQVIEVLERRIVCMPLSINVFVTPATQ
jgi:hypothetical protein